MATQRFAPVGRVLAPAAGDKGRQGAGAGRGDILSVVELGDLQSVVLKCIAFQAFRTTQGEPSRLDGANGSAVVTSSSSTHATTAGVTPTARPAYHSRPQHSKKDGSHAAPQPEPLGTPHLDDDL